jgi:DNA replication protein DnaC
VLLTSNLVFSEWERIFKDPMTTAAGRDRRIHKSVFLELNLPSYRMEAAQKKKAAKGMVRSPGIAPILKLASLAFT